MCINHNTFGKRLLFLLLASSFLSLLIACGSSGTSSTQAAVGNTTSLTGSSQLSSGQDSTMNVSTTAVMPQTQTGCPAPGTGRAVVMPPLATHGKQTLVYMNNDRLNGGTLIRLDTATSKKTVIYASTTTNFTHAQVSTDGQWILFVSTAHNLSKLQLIRMDGQGLQTLYCDTLDAVLGSNSIVWSNNQHSIVFSLYGPKGNISFLDVRTGHVHVSLVTPMQIVTMLDNTRVYVALPATDAPPSTLALLDTSKGANQHIKDLRLVFVQAVEPPSAYPCWNADSSYDATRLFISQCVATADTTHPGIGAYKGPSTIELRGVTGDAPSLVLKNAHLAITDVRAVTPHMLLIQTTVLVSNPDGSKTAKNDLWSVGTSGIGLTHLIGSDTRLNQYVQTPWANVSRDGKYYAFETYVAKGEALSSTVGYGSLQGGKTTTIASNLGGEVSIVGWTLL